MTSPQPSSLPDESSSRSDAESSGSQQSHIISRVLAPALRLWLRSQVERVDDLQVQIEGGDRQLLSGHIPQVQISAQNAVYQGLHLSQISLAGGDIRVNLGQVLRGKPLRLLHVVPVVGELWMQEADLNASLQAPLLAKALTDFLVELLRSPASTDVLPIEDSAALNLQNPQAKIAAEAITLSANLISTSGNSTPIVIRTGLGLANGHTLTLDRPQWLPHLQAKRGLPLDDLHNTQIELGTDIDLQELTLQDGQIFCRGRINVTP